jgi:hypothetical protein
VSERGYVLMGGIDMIDGNIRQRALFWMVWVEARLDAIKTVCAAMLAVVLRNVFG